MTTQYKKIQAQLLADPKIWLVTGVAGFIGSNLLETLLKLNQRVVGLDNFATGFQHNLDEVQGLVTSEQWANFQFIQGDICNLEDCQRACAGVDYVLHQAALGSVPRSIENPINTNGTNISGFLNMLVAARDAKVKRLVYAASSSTYGDHPALPKVEENIGKPLSPYAVTKLVNELYAEVFARTYGFKTIGLRYFNVFGPRQNPNGAYAAVIPKWTASMIKNEPVYINGDGETSRDFCFIQNAVQINLLAATATEPVIANSEGAWQSSEPRHCEEVNAGHGNPPASSLRAPVGRGNPEVDFAEGDVTIQPTSPTNQIYNVAVGDRTTLNQLYEMIRTNLQDQFPHLINAKPVYRDFRSGDVRHSLADIGKANRLLGYQPTHRIGEGLKVAMKWYVGGLYEGDIR